MYAALPSGCGSRSGGCGDCVEVCGSKGCVVVKVVDTCVSCSCGDIDLSTDALKASTGYSWDRKHVTWKWTSCSGGSSASSADTSSSSSSDEESDSKRKVRIGTASFCCWLQYGYGTWESVLSGLPCWSFSALLTPSACAALPCCRGTTTTAAF